jgi:hypothetical protein
MSTQRRLYFYVLTFISLEVLVWGAIGLGRELAAGQGWRMTDLARAAALVLVGAPVFVFHGWQLQRAGRQEPEERSSRLRAVFLYGVLLATVVPAIHNLWVLLNRLGLEALLLPRTLAWVGRQQTYLDNLIALGLNGLAAVGFFLLLRADWRAGPAGEAYAETRRLSRYAWLLYGLGLGAVGVQQLAAYLMSLGHAATLGALVNGMAALLVGLPTWGLAAWLIRRSLMAPEEREAPLREAVLRTGFLLSQGVTLVLLGVALTSILLVIMAQFGNWILVLEWLAQRPQLSALAPAALLWLYFGLQLRPAAPARGDPTRLQRFGHYWLAWLGLWAAVWGAQVALATGVEWALGLRHMPFLPGGLAALAIATPLWLLNWRQAGGDTRQPGEAGALACRSRARRTYLYTTLFCSVLGVMAGGGALVYHLLAKALGQPERSWQMAAGKAGIWLLLCAAVLVYHALSLRRDRHRIAAALAIRHAAYPVLVLAPEDESYVKLLLEALQQSAPQLPVAVHAYSQGAPDALLSTARAVILPADLAARPAEALRVWLQTFNGERLVLPAPTPGWHWVGSGRMRPLPALARQAARLVRRLAEGEAAPMELSPWLAGLYVAIGLLGVGVLAWLWAGVGRSIF